MGYPTHYHHVLSRTNCIAALSLCLVLCLFPADGFTAAAPRPAHLPHGDWDHLIITDASLVGSFAPLARHRRAEGLRSRVVSVRL